MKLDNQQSAKTTSRPALKPKLKFIPDASIFKNLGITSDNITNLQTAGENEKSAESSPQDLVKLDPQTATKPELQKLCGNYGIAKSGTKKLLIERLIKNGVLKPEHPEDEKNWSSKSRREDLMVACSKRVLATDGSKSDLMQRLQQYEDTRTKLYIIGGNTKDEKVEANGEVAVVAKDANEDLAVKKRRLSDETNQHPTIVTLDDSLEISDDSVNEQSKAILAILDDSMEISNGFVNEQSKAKEDKNDSMEISNDSVNEQSKAKEDKEHNNVDVSDLLASDDSQSEDTDDELSDGDFEKLSEKSDTDPDEEISFRNKENVEIQSKESFADTDEEMSDDDFEKLYNQVDDSSDSEQEHADVEEKIVEESVTVISVCAKKVDSSPTQYYPSFVSHYVTLEVKPVANEDPEVAKETEVKIKAPPTFFAFGSFVNSSGSPEKVKFIS